MEWNAAWIWHPPTDDPDNFYLYARRELSLDRVPQRAPLHVTAGALYALYVNGRFVGRGPNPADPSRYYYDTYDAAEYLREGQNCVAAVAYCYGPEPHGVLNQNWGRGGFLLEMRDGDGEVLLKTDGSWSVIQSPAWRQDAPINCTLYGDFKEIVDTRQEPEGWREAGFDDSDWTAPEVLGSPPVEPWTQLVEREIPRLTREPVRPVNAWWESASVTYSWREDFEVYNERHLARHGPGGRPDDPVRVKKTHDDFPPSLILDFGRDVTGYLEITVADSDGGVVDVLYGEDLYLVRVDRFVLKGGRQVLRPFNRRTFRYCKLLFQQTPEEVHLEDVTLQMSTYPVEHRGDFRCSDDRLNRIWRVGRYTMRMSMLDHFVDCPWRERTLYGGDMYAENLIAHYAFGNPRLNAKSLRQMAHIQFEAGALPPYGPYRGADGFYPSWSAFWGLALLDHWRFHADRELLDELWPNLRKLLEWTLGEIDNEHDLMGRPTGLGKKREHGEDWDPFRAWMEAEKARWTPWDNLPFQKLLERAARAARATGREEEAASYADAAERMAEAARRKFVDPETGLCHGRGTDGPGQYNTGMHLWTGRPEHGAARRAVKNFFNPGVKCVGAPFGGLFIIDGLFRYGAAQEALDFMRTYWGGMLDRGATTWWDNFSLNWGAGVMPNHQTSLCHGWAAGPTYALPAYVLGVRPLEPGFERVLIRPQPGDLEWAAGAVPTPDGEVRVEWARSARRFEMEAELPAGCTGRVEPPPSADPRVEVHLDGEQVEAERSDGRLSLLVEPGEHRVEVRRAR